MLKDTNTTQTSMGQWTKNIFLRSFMVSTFLPGRPPINDCSPFGFMRNGLLSLQFCCLLCYCCCFFHLSQPDFTPLVHIMKKSAFAYAANNCLILYSYIIIKKKKVNIKLTKIEETDFHFYLRQVRNEHIETMTWNNTNQRLINKRFLNIYMCSPHPRQFMF